MLSPYRHISTGIWDDARFAPLSTEAKLLFICVFAGPHTQNLPGLAVVGLGALSDTLRMKPSVVEKAFAEVVATGLVQYDERTRVVRAPNGPKHHPAVNGNIVKGWRKAFDRIPDCDLKRTHIESLRAAVTTPAAEDEFAKQFGNSSTNSSPNSSGTGGGTDHQPQGSVIRDQRSKRSPEAPLPEPTVEVPPERASGGLRASADTTPKAPEPAPGLAERLRDAWCDATGQPASEVPVTARHQAAAAKLLKAFDGDEARVRTGLVGCAVARDEFHRRRGFGLTLSVDAISAGFRLPPRDTAAASRAVHQATAHDDDPDDRVPAFDPPSQHGATP